jgi:predicted phosphodiesterase
MSIVVISDLHFEKGSFHGVYQGGALDWLLDMVDKTKPAALVGLGDWGYAWTGEDWNSLTEKVTTHAIFGNHDDVYLLESRKNKDGSKVLVHDGKIRNIEGIKFGFINGIMSNKGTTKHNVPRSTSEDFLRIASNFKGIDILCTHESPIVPEYGKKFDSGVRACCNGKGN